MKKNRITSTICYGKSISKSTTYSVFLIHTCYIRINFKDFLSNIFSFIISLIPVNIITYTFCSFVIEN